MITVYTYASALRNRIAPDNASWCSTVNTTTGVIQQQIEQPPSLWQWLCTQGARPWASNLPMAGMTRLASGPSAHSNCHTQNCSKESSPKLLSASRRIVWESNLTNSSSGRKRETERASVCVCNEEVVMVDNEREREDGSSGVRDYMCVRA